MLPVAWLVVAVLAAVLLTTWVTFTVTRLERLYARLDAARAALDAQLVRRAAVLLQVAETPTLPVPAADRARWEMTAHAALHAAETATGRVSAENAVGRCVAELAAQLIGHPADAAAELAAGELQETAARVLVARRFYNDAVRDTRTLRDSRLPWLLRHATPTGFASGDRARPQFFDIDDTLPVTGLRRARPVTPPDTVPAGLAPGIPVAPVGATEPTGEGTR